MTVSRGSTPERCLPASGLLGLRGGRRGGRRGCATCNGRQTRQLATERTGEVAFHKLKHLTINFKRKKTQVSVHACKDFS